MEVLVLGNGGFHNAGLPYNSLLIDGHILVDCPPDILQSLSREKIDLGAIDTVMLTHFHGDHCFGLPFLLFNMPAYREARSGAHGGARMPLTICSPKGGRSFVKELLSRAIDPGHPYVRWAEEAPAYVEMREGGSWTAASDALRFEFYRTAHEPETYSIVAYLAGGATALFVATSDTAWDRRLEPLFSLGARLYLCDGNGKGLGGVHMSPEELERFAMPLLGPESRLVATHLSEAPREGGPIRFAVPGDRFKL